MDPIIIALYHGTLLRKFNLFFLNQPRTLPNLPFFFLILLALLLLDFSCMWGGGEWGVDFREEARRQYNYQGNASCSHRVRNILYQ
jgi:hypothetical protein